MFKNRTIAYIVLTYVLTGLYSLLYLKFPLKVGEPISFAVTVVYMFMPLIATLILQVIVYKEPLKNIGFVFKWNNWYIFAAIAPIVTALMTFGVSFFMPGVTYDPSLAGFMEKMSKMIPPEQMEKAAAQLKPMMNYILLITTAQALVFGVTVNAVAAFGEEAGWRGFFLSSLDGKNFYVASIIIGLIWGFWHAPVVLQGHNYPEHKVFGVFMMTVFTILLSPIMVYVVKKSGSVLAAAFFHGVLNASGTIPMMFIKGGDDLTVGITGAAGLIALFIFNILLFMYDKFIATEKVINI